jgi:hypothetical protein
MKSSLIPEQALHYAVPPGASDKLCEPPQRCNGAQEKLQTNASTRWAKRTCCRQE